MRKLSKLLFAAALAATAFFSLPPKALAVDPNSPICQHCNNYGDCFSCCRCDGGTVATCSMICS
jgi:hypothetical protein